MKEINIKFRVNRVEHSLNVEPDKSLLYILREKLRLTGTKEGCGKGECGACTVIMDGKTVDSCLVFASQVDNSEITTIEGIGDEKRLHIIQRSFIEEGGVQCGFCTPGFIMSVYDLLRRNPEPDIDDIKEAVSGNLCRCTGYSKIFRAIKKAANYYSSNRISRNKGAI